MTNLHVTHETIDNAFNSLLNLLEDQQSLVEQQAAYEIKKADAFEELRQDPDFKPGRSNAERDAKLRMYYPGIMEASDQIDKELSDVNAEISRARLDVERVQSHLRLLKVIAALKDSE